MCDRATQYDLTFEERPGYLYANVKDTSMSEEMSAAFLGEIADKCAELGISRVIINRDVPVIINSSSLFFSMQVIVKILRGLKVAVLNPFPSNDEALNFAVVVAN